MHPVRRCRRLGHGAMPALRGETMRVQRIVITVVGAGAVAVSAGCTPTLRVEVPDKPIEINLNINMKIEQDVRVKLDRALDQAAAENPGIF
jgi:YnbE-like lipoprotein